MDTLKKVTVIVEFQFDGVTDIEALMDDVNAHETPEGAI